jgi:hypothetical protein
MASVKITAILPKKAFLLDQRKLNIELNSALNKTANLIRSDFRKTVRTWTTKPVFRKMGPRHGAVEVFTSNRIYFFVSGGTRAHPITPLKPGGLLRFRGRFRAKTRVRVIGSRAGGASGPFVTAKRVAHPGTEPRDFDKVIAERRQTTFRKLTRNAVIRASKS